MQRVCQPCTACCDGWVQMNIDGEEVYPGRPCQHSTGKGCSIYPERPEDPCRRFQCAWIMENSGLPKWMKPNLAKVVVLPALQTWNGRPVDVAVPVGRRIPPRALKWLMDYAKTNLRPLIYFEQPNASKPLGRQQNMIGYGPPAFQQEILMMAQRGERRW
jgi:hypothetical protein